MKLYRFSNNPVVGQWVPLTDRQPELVNAQLTEIQQAQLENRGSAEVSFQDGNARWPAMLVRAHIKSYSPTREGWSI